MKIKLLAFTVLAATFFTSCNKDEDTSANVASNISASGDYFPMAKGNIWNYAGALPYSTFINKDTLIGGILYYKVETSQGGASYITKNGDDYEIIDPTSTGSWASNIFLKEAGVVGDYWNYSLNTYGPGYVQTNEYTFSIFGTLPSMIVNGITYNDILVIDNDLDLYIDGYYYRSVNDTRYYYAKGVGLISSQLPTVGNTNLTAFIVQ
jgi:hypothetical protein